MAHESHAPTSAPNAGKHAEHTKHAEHAAGVRHAALPDLAARYELQVGQQRTDWYLWREQDSVETATAAIGQNSIWQRLGDEGYHFLRVFNKEQRVVEYVPGELRTRHAEPDWEKLSSVVSPHMLEKLKRGSVKTLFGQKAVRYTGKIGGQVVDIWWLERDQLPASLRIGDGANGRRMQLRELHAKSPQDWPRTTEAQMAKYALIDAADLGDMEYDPFVARLMQAEGHSHAH
jgi:hypothetical protein